MYRKFLVKNPSNSSFYFRSHIPLELRPLFGGSIEFRVSLECGNKIHSKKICVLLNQITQSLYQEVRMGKFLTIDEMKVILRKEIEKSKKHSSWFSYVGVDRSKESSKGEGLNTLKMEELELKGKRKTDFDDEVLGLLEKEGITTVNKNSDSFRLFRENYIKVQNLKIKWKREILIGESVSDFDLVSKIMEEDQEVLPSQDTIPKPKLHPLELESKPLSEVRERFIKRREGKVSDKLIEEYRRNLDELIEIVGDIPIKGLTKDVLSDKYIETQLKLPINRNKNPRYRDLSIQEILELSNVDPQSGVNVNKYLGRLSTVFKWSRNQGFVDENVFDGMKVQISKSEQRKRREPFTSEELKKILKPNTYLKWTKNFKHRWSDITTNQNPYYWIFLIGIFSGMRTNEICQLRTSDVFEEDGCWMFNIEESDTTNVKTKSGIRKIPIHPMLKSLDFIQYVQIVKDMGKDRIFWELNKERDGYQKKVTRHYNEKFLPEIGVWKRQVKVLYCSRHTFINKCYKKGVNRDIIKYLVGHEPDFTIDVYGGDPFTNEQLYKGISKVSYSGIRFERLNIDWRQYHEKT